MASQLLVNTELAEVIVAYFQLRDLESIIQPCVDADALLKDKDERLYDYFQNDPSGISFWSIFKTCLESVLTKNLLSPIDILHDSLKVKLAQANANRVVEYLESTQAKGFDLKIHQIFSNLEEFTHRPIEDTQREELVGLLPSFFTATLNRYALLKVFSLGTRTIEDLSKLKINDQILKIESASQLFFLAKRMPDGISLVAVAVKGDREENSYFGILIKLSKNIFWAEESLSVMPFFDNNTTYFDEERIRKSVFPFCMMGFDQRTGKKSNSTEHSLSVYKPVPEIACIGKLSGIGNERLLPIILLLQEIIVNSERLYQAPCLKTGIALQAKTQDLPIPTVFQPNCLDFQIPVFEDCDASKLAKLGQKIGLQIDIHGRLAKIEETYQSSWVGQKLLSESTDRFERIAVPTYCRDRGVMPSETIDCVYLHSWSEDLLASEAQLIFRKYYRARQAKAALLEAAIYADFENSTEKLICWFKDVAAQQETIFRRIANFDLVGAVTEFKVVQKANGAIFNAGLFIAGRSRAAGLISLSKFDGDDRSYCYESGQKASLHFKIEMFSSNVIADVTGIPEDELPFGLNFVGLEREHKAVDPVENMMLPQFSYRPVLYVGYSVTGFNRLRTRYGLTKLSAKVIESEVIALRRRANDL